MHSALACILFSMCIKTLLARKEWTKYYITALHCYNVIDIAKGKGRMPRKKLFKFLGTGKMLRKKMFKYLGTGRRKPFKFLGIGRMQRKKMFKFLGTGRMLKFLGTGRLLRKEIFKFLGTGKILRKKMFKFLGTPNTSSGKGKVPRKKPFKFLGTPNTTGKGRMVIKRLLDTAGKGRMLRKQPFKFLGTLNTCAYIVEACMKTMMILLHGIIDAVENKKLYMCGPFQTFNLTQCSGSVY